ncbi:MAG: ABC transporter ATP-binding protein [Anaerolineaceae bacterium]|nr:MAG: ABC transporter ATP-binding protein [Anaerolineaceae bacterium]
MSSLLRLRTFIRPYIPQIVLNLILLLAITALSLYVPRVIRQVVDVGLAAGAGDALIRSALVLFGLGLGTAILNLGHRYLSEWIAARIGYDLRNRLYDHIQRQAFTYHDHTQSGQLISRCIEDVSAIQRFAGSAVIETIQFLLLTVGILWLMTADNLKLAVISLLPMIPLVYRALEFGTRIGGLFFKVDNAVGEVSNRLQENVSGVQVVRAFAREDYEIGRFNFANKEVFKHWVNVIDQWARIMPLSNFLIALGTILLLWFGGPMVLEGEITLGALVAFNSYILMLGAPAQQLTQLVNAAGEATAGAQRVFEVLDHPSEIQSPRGAGDAGQLRGEVEFEGVGLSYQDERIHALDGISLKVEPNRIVALMGQTGSGKTSLVNLIPRFYDVTQGRVLVDGRDVRELDLVSLRRQIGIVLQTSLLFSDSIRANIAYGRPDATEEEIFAAAQAAQAHEFILELPQGYGTVVGERGVTLSGGQRQRVAIARALLMNPRILILDDSTSSVDTQTEKLIQSALDQLMEGRTTFVIAHRLSTVRRADLIVVMDKGCIVQRGTHKDLLRQKGLYRKIYDLQLKGHEKFTEEMEELGQKEFVEAHRRSEELR